VVDSVVAFHNSALSPEGAGRSSNGIFGAAAIRALVSTSTLAIGMNLPLKNVVLDPQRWDYLHRYGRWLLGSRTHARQIRNEYFVLSHGSRRRW